MNKKNKESVSWSLVAVILGEVLALDKNYQVFLQLDLTVLGVR